jgi:hypothetical protein
VFAVSTVDALILTTYPVAPGTAFHDNTPSENANPVGTASGVAEVVDIDVVLDAVEVVVVREEVAGLHPTTKRKPKKQETKRINFLIGLTYFATDTMVGVMTA